VVRAGRRERSVGLIYSVTRSHEVHALKTGVVLVIHYPKVIATQNREQGDKIFAVLPNRGSMVLGHGGHALK
jgi:hypothetical protein